MVVPLALWLLAAVPPHALAASTAATAPPAGADGSVAWWQDRAEDQRLTPDRPCAAEAEWVDAEIGYDTVLLPMAEAALRACLEQEAARLRLADR